MQYQYCQLEVELQNIKINAKMFVYFTAQNIKIKNKIVLDRPT